jgi:hypothetical protein
MKAHCKTIGKITQHVHEITGDEHRGFGVVNELLIRIFALVGSWRKKGVQGDNTSAVYGFQLGGKYYTVFSFNMGAHETI